MTKTAQLDIDPALDLVLERDLDVPQALVWKLWTEPEHVKRWFAPAPWTISECDIDLRPGGQFYTVMQSPEGGSFPNMGCYLEVVPNEKLVFTNALAPGYIKTDMSPVDDPKFHRHWIEDTPMQRYGSVEELAPAVVFLASEASSFVTGSVLVADGGYSVF